MLGELSCTYPGLGEEGRSQGVQGMVEKLREVKEAWNKKERVTGSWLGLTKVSGAEQ